MIDSVLQAVSVVGVNVYNAESSGVGGGGQTGNSQGVWVKDEKWVLFVFILSRWFGQY